MDFGLSYNIVLEVLAAPNSNTHNFYHLLTLTLVFGRLCIRLYVLVVAI